MSVKKIIATIVDNVDIAIGKGFAFLDAHASVVIGLEQDLLNALQNPDIPLVLASILPPQLIAQVPNIEALLQKAIADELAGTKIAADVQAAPTTEEKLRILIADIQATPGMNKGIIRDICLSVLASLNNNALKADEYAFYLYAKKLMAA